MIITNKVILTGRLTRDPESRVTQSNMEVARFSIAAQNDFANKNGERDVEFINCIAFNKLAEIINKFCNKGKLVAVQGRIQNRSYEAKDGSKKYSTDVIVEQLEFLSSSKTESNTTNTNTPTNQNETVEDPYQAFADDVVLDESMLPF